MASSRRAIELNPDYPRAYEYRAEVRRAQKQYAQAVEDYPRLLGMIQDKGPIYLKLSDVHHDMGRDDEAVKDCTQALALNPKDAKATYKRAGLVLQDVERLAEMVSSTDRPLQIIFGGKAHPRIAWARS